MPTIKDIAPESVFTIELNAGTPGIQGPQGPQGVQGPVGPEGKIGPKPIRGIDYFTQQDINNMVSTVTSSSNSAFNGNVANRTTEFNSNVSIKTTAFDNNALLKTEDFNTNAKTKKTDFNLNANNRTTEFNTNASDKKKTFDDNANEKQNSFDTHIANKTTIFDKHVEDKINEFKEETSEYVTETELNNKGYLVQNDLNGYAKEEDLFSGSYNDLENKPNIPSKTSELTNDKGFINEIPSEYVTEEEQTEFIKPYNERIEQNEKYISELEATIDILTNTDTKKGELVHITDALPLATFENKVDGNVKQETTTGKNLVDFGGNFDGEYIGSRTFENDTLTLTSPGGTYKYITKDMTELIKNNPGKTLKFTEESYSVINTSINPGVQLGVEYNDGTTKLYRSLRSYKSNTSDVYNIPSDTSNIKKVMFSVFANNSTTDLNNTLTIVKPMLYFDKGDSTYEPYTNGASPNPEYPQEIEVLEGYNLFKPYEHTENGITSKIVNGKLRVTGTATKNFNFNIMMETIFNGTYTFSCYGNTTIWYWNRTSQTTDITLRNTSKTTTYNSDTVLLGAMTITNGQTYDITIEPMIVEGTEQKPYLPYGCVDYKVNGKNLLNVDAKKNTYNGMEFTPIYKDNGTLDYINVNGTATSDTYLRVHQIERYDIDKQKTYIINGSPSGGSTKTYGMVTYYYDENNTYINGVYEFGNGVQIPQSAKLNVNIFVKSGVTMNNAKFYPMLRLASDTDDDYEPYQEQIVPLDLKGNWVGAINDDIRDYLVTDKKKYWLVKNVGKYVFTGDENNLVLRATYNNICQFELRIFDGFYQQYNAINIISSHYKGIAFMSDTGNSWTIDNTITIIGDGNIVIMTSQFTTVEEFKAYLKEQYNNGTPVVAYYRPKTPQIIELGTLEEPIKTFEGVNNIQLLANLDTEIEVVYAQDVKKYYDNKLAEISAQII